MGLRLGYYQTYNNIVCVGNSSDDFLALPFLSHLFTHAGSDQKVEVCKQYGADVAINYKTQDFAVEVLSATAERGISVATPQQKFTNKLKHKKCLSLQGLISFLILLVPHTGRNTANVSPQMAESYI